MFITPRSIINFSIYVGQSSSFEHLMIEANLRAEIRIKIIEGTIETSIVPTIILNLRLASIIKCTKLID